MDATEKLALNAWIERLIDSKGHDAEARSKVADFGRAIQQAKALSFKAGITKSGGNVLGETPQQGSVLVNDDRKETKEYSAGEVVERVGYYKLWRLRRWICVSHFWKSDVGTESETELAQEWALALDRHGLPEWFGERARYRMFSFRITRALAVIVSRNVFIESWGAQEGRRHHGGFHIAIEVEVSDKD